MTEPEPELLPEPDYSGSTFDRYHLIRRLGVGGMGAVYEAEHTELRKHCAVKMLRHELAQNEMFRRRFLREARAASAVAHPHVVDISDYGETSDGHVYFVMELFQGRELQALLDTEGRLSWPRTREILLQVTSALEAAHRLGVIHRDIKPSNCFLVDLPGLGGEDFVKVLDFGIAKVSSNLDESTKQLTSTQEIFGTVAYMAPEMAMGKSDEPRSDIYALGVMMYRMLVGELPFTEGNAFQILSQHVSDPPPLPRSKVPSIPEEVEAIILKAMAKKPSERFATMEEFGLALRRGSLASTDEPLGLQATVLGLHALGDTPTTDHGTPVVAKTTALPSSGVVVEPVHIRSGSVLASESGPMVIGDEPTMMATPIGFERIEPTVSLEVPLDTSPKRVEPTVSLDTSPKRIEPTVLLDTSPSALEATSPSEPMIGRRTRALLWVAVPTLGLAAAIGSFAALYEGSSDDAPTMAVHDARDARPAPTTPTTAPKPTPPAATIVAPAPAPVATAPVATAPVATAPVATAPPEPEAVTQDAALDPSSEAATPEPEPEPEPEPPPVENPKPAPKKAARAKAPKRSSGSTSDAFLEKKLARKILDECRFEMAGKRVTVSFFVTPSGAISLLTASPKNQGAECAKDQVKGTKFPPRSEDTPIKIVVN